MTQRTTVNGIPALQVDYPPGHEHRVGEVTAGMTFRVGAADEPVPSRGITHLIEHLVLADLGQQPFSYNGSVGPLLTSFTASGTADEVTRFFAHVCDGLASLPTDRLSDQVRVLSLEADRHAASIPERLLRLRYGLQGWGKLSFDEMVLFRTNMPDLQTWARDWFTRENVVLWTVGEAPTIEVPLPSGRRMPPPATAAARFPLPAWESATWGCAALSLVGPRTSAFVGLAALLQRRAMGRLRHRDAVVYEVDGNYTGMDRDIAHVALWSGVTDDTAAAVAHCFDDVLAEVVAKGPDAQELSELIGPAYPPTDQATLLPNVERELLGLPLLDAGEIRRETEALTAADFESAARETFPERVIVAPPAVAVHDGFTPISQQRSTVVHGRRYRSLAPRSKERLVIGDAGLSVYSKKVPACTVLWKDIALAATWSNGARQIFGTDGTSIRVDLRWANFPAVDRKLKASVPQDAVALMSTQPLGVPVGVRKPKRLDFWVALAIAALTGLPSTLIVTDAVHQGHRAELVVGLAVAAVGAWVCANAARGWYRARALTARNAQPN